ncbi:hypothetical protein BDA96_04G261300 [Sorghum bicolor]|uniref:Uncharacterized protein n=2 Tax=Sorghum bicolor TaxID=4558 RepID=A0A921UJA4_SORBI|nr:hypothetical protein BDA96_04G261300 [Sorghum bicolor]OQU85446.1 hypothetical protein SORBI_3004G245450 [Sorghum bicolor]
MPWRRGRRCREHSCRPPPPASPPTMMRYQRHRRRGRRRRIGEAYRGCCCPWRRKNQKQALRVEAVILTMDARRDQSVHACIGAYMLGLSSVTHKDLFF